MAVAAEAAVPRSAPAPRAADWATDGWERTEPQPTGASPISWLRRNPADAYLREPTRRLNRRDALLRPGTLHLCARLPALAARRPARRPLRRGLSRAVRHGVAQQLAERLGPGRVRVDAPDAGQVPDRGWHRARRPEQGRRQQRPRRAVAHRSLSRRSDRRSDTTDPSSSRPPEVAPRSSLPTPRVATSSRGGTPEGRSPASPTTRRPRACWSDAPTSGRSRRTSLPACSPHPTAAHRPPVLRSRPT